MPARPAAGCVQVPTCVLPLPWNFDPGVASAIATMEPHLQVDPPSSLGVDMSFTGSVGSLPPSPATSQRGPTDGSCKSGTAASSLARHSLPVESLGVLASARGPERGGVRDFNSHRSSCWGDGNFLPSLTISIVKNHLVKSHSAYGIPSSPTTTTKPSPTRPACPPSPPWRCVIRSHCDTASSLQQLKAPAWPVVESAARLIAPASARCICFLHAGHRTLDRTGTGSGSPASSPFTRHPSSSSFSPILG